MPQYQEIFANCCKFNTLNLFVSVFFSLSRRAGVSHARNIQKNNLLQNKSSLFFYKKCRAVSYAELMGFQPINALKRQINSAYGIAL
jgi:hypothetical protein